MSGNAGKGREVGSRNKRNLALMLLAEGGETPCAFALRIMRDEGVPPQQRLDAARLAAPYIHSKPQPETRTATFAVPEKIETAEDLLAVHATLLKVTASGELGLEDARDISAVLETHRKLVETADLEQRITKLEERQERKP